MVPQKSYSSCGEIHNFSDCSRLRCLRRMILILARCVNMIHIVNTQYSSRCTNTGIGIAILSKLVLQYRCRLSATILDQPIMGIQDLVSCRQRTEKRNLSCVGWSSVEVAESKVVPVSALNNYYILHI